MTTPLIGIEVDLEPNAAGRRYAKCYETYFDAVSDAGGAPILLPPTGEAQLRTILGAVHGVVVPGGDDFHASDWGEEQRPCERYVPSDSRRLRHGRQLISLVLELEKPYLGVCYGAQLLNLALGGTLVQDLPQALGEAAASHAGQAHAVAVEPGSLLRRLVGADVIAVNSRHHQSNLQCGKGLRVSAKAPDGVVEAIEAEGGFLLGVQWHAEELVGEPGGSRIFAGLVEAARQAQAQLA